jgi:Protein of unknown function (DUF732)
MAFRTIAASLLVLLLAACGSPHATTTSNRTPDTAYIADLQASGATFATMKPVPLIGYGHELCSDLDGGQTVADISGSALIGDIEAKAWNVMVRAAVKHFCPQHRDEVSR